MEKSAPYFITGLFVSVLIAALTGFVIWLANPHRPEDYTRYTVYFTDSVNGLSEGADVKYKGVDVGKVLNMRISSAPRDLVKVDIEVAREAPVRAQTRAVMGMAGLTGLAFLELTTPPEDNEKPRRRPGEPYPVLEGQGTQVAKILDNLNKFSTQGLEQIISLSQETQRMAESIRRFSDKLQKDPSQIIYQQTSAGVEIPR